LRMVDQARALIPTLGLPPARQVVGPPLPASQSQAVRQPQEWRPPVLRKPAGGRGEAWEGELDEWVGEGTGRRTLLGEAMLLYRRTFGARRPDLDSVPAPFAASLVWIAETLADGHGPDSELATWAAGTVVEEALRAERRTPR